MEQELGWSWLDGGEEEEDVLIAAPSLSCSLGTLPPIRRFVFPVTNTLPA